MISHLAIQQLASVSPVLTIRTSAMTEQCKVGERQSVIVQNLEKTLRTAPVLNVGLAVFSRCSEVKRIALADELSEFRRNLRLPAAALFHLGIGFARASLLLGQFDAGSEGDVAGVSGHRILPIARMECRRPLMVATPGQASETCVQL